MYNHPYYNQAQDYIKSIGFDESELFTKAFLAGVNARDNDLSDIEAAIIYKFAQYNNNHPEISLHDFISSHLTFEDV